MSRRPEAEHPERYDPDTMGGLIQADHEARYQWAAAAVAGKEVLDAACGVGYGVGVLDSVGAARVVGIDRSAAAIEKARRRLGGLAELLIGDLHELPFPAGSFDVVVCFEAIEHVEDPECVLDELKRVLRPDGFLLLSTPNRSVNVHGNPHHLREYLPAELEATLEGRFRCVELYRQHPWVASLITVDRDLALADPSAELEAVVRKVAGIAPGEELFTLAVAGDADLPRLSPLTMLGDAVDVRAWQRSAAVARDLELLRGSLSWRVTAPLRALRARIGRLRGRS